MKNKFFWGLFFAPIFPICIYFLDVSFNEANFCLAVKEVVDFLSVSYVNNFYNFQYQRTVFFMAIFLSPLIVGYWFCMCDISRFSLNNWRQAGKIFSGVLVLFLLPTFIAFLPAAQGDDLNRKQLDFIMVHRNPLLFTIVVYFSLFIAYMALGTNLRHLFIFIRREFNVRSK